MADDLLDAPWATGGGDTDTLPDAPWASAAPAPARTNPMGGGPLPATTEARQWAKDRTTIRPDQSASIFGTPIPKQQATYGDTLDQYYDEAEAKMRAGIKTLTDKYSAEGLKKRSFGDLFSTPGALADIASGAIKGTIAPVTAAVTPYWEKYTGIPGEEAAGAVMAGMGAGEVTAGLRGVRGLSSPAALPAPAVRPPGPPDPKNPLTWKDGQPPAPATPTPAIPQVAPTATPPTATPSAPVATPRPNTGVRLLDPEVPHAGRTSVGAASSNLDPLAGYSPETVTFAKKLMEANGLDNPHMLEQALDERSQHHMLGELSPGLESEMGGVAVHGGEGRNTIVGSVGQRHREAPERIGAVLDRFITPPENRAALQQSLEEARNKSSHPMWRTFTNTTVAPTPEIRSILPRLDAAGALKAANKAMREEGLPAQQGFGRMVTNEEGEWAQEVEHVPTAAAFQYAKEHLDELIDSALKDDRAKAAGRYTRLKNDLLKAIDNHPDQNVAGIWKEARRLWQEPSELIAAQKLGERLLTQNIHREDLPNLIGDFSPEQMRHLELGMRGRLEDLELANERNPARASNKLLDAVLNNQQKIREVLGDERGDGLIEALRHEDSLHRAPERIYGNSATAGRTAAAEKYAAPSGVTGTIISGVLNPRKTAVKAVGEAGMDYLAKKRETAAAKLREELARLFTTQGAERDAVARALIGAKEPPASGWRPRPSPAATPPPSRPPSAAAAPSGGWQPVTAQQIAAGATPVVKAAPIPAEAAAPKGKSLLEFLASKGGVEPTPDMMGILGKNKFLGTHGWVLRKGGLSEDKARELAAEAGYIANEGRGGVENRGGGTSTIRDLHEAINDEARGRKRYAMGEERMPEMSPEEARHRFENDVMDHLDQEGVPMPSGEAHQRMLDLVEKEGLSPLEAHERAIMEDFYAGQDEGLPAAKEIAGKLPDVSRRASNTGVSPEGQQASASQRSGAPSRISGESHPGSVEPTGHGPNFENLKQASAVRLADSMGVTPQIQHLAMTGKSDAEIAHFLSNRLPVESIRMVREHLGIGAASSLMRAGDEIPFPLQRDVIERDQRGRAMRTERLRMGNENERLERFHQAMLANAEDAAEQRAIEDEWNRMTPQQQDAETAKWEHEQAARASQRTNKVAAAVDAALDMGWQPKLNMIGGLHRDNIPSELKEFASPASLQAIMDHLRDRGIIGVHPMGRASGGRAMLKGVAR